MDDDIGPCREWPGPRDPKTGYGRIRWGSSGFVSAHRWVWISAHGEVPEVDGKPGLVLHRCSNPPCTRLDHLYCASHADNMRDMVLAGNHAGGGVSLGADNGQSKLTDDDVREIRRLYRDGEIQTKIARTFSITQSQVSEIVRGLAWAHVT